MSISQHTVEELRSSIRKFTYDTERYPFTRILRKIFDDWDDKIENLHLFFQNSDMIKQITIDEDTKTKFHRHYYDSQHYQEMLDLYYTFVKEIVLPLFKTDDTEFIVQKDPCFRINIPNNTALGKRTSMNDPDDKIGIHCDGEYGHPDSEINFMLSFGYQRGTNSCYIETQIGNEIYEPVEIKYGEFINFYGNKLRHFNKVNTTGESRVSIDFRIIPKSLYDNNNTSVSLHGKRPFLIGGYYIELSKE